MLKTPTNMKTINSNAVKNEVFNMQVNNGLTSSKSSKSSLKANKFKLLVLAYLAAIAGVLYTLSALNLIPKD